jgi:hypothetical protein
MCCIKSRIIIYSATAAVMRQMVSTKVFSGWIMYGYLCKPREMFAIACLRGAPSSDGGLDDVKAPIFF